MIFHKSILIEIVSSDGRMGIFRKMKADFKVKAKIHDQILIKRRRMVKRKMNRYFILAQLYFGDALNSIIIYMYWTKLLDRGNKYESLRTTPIGSG